jgi:hypothetical protein
MAHPNFHGGDMKHRRSLFICTIIVAVLLTTLACGLPSVVSNTGSTSPIRQWASSASASSEFGSSDWSAQQAVGEPNTAACGDQITAWASADYDGVDWLDVGFATPVVPTQINIHESYTPGSIIKVEVRDTDGTFHTVWEDTPNSVSQCPRVFTVNVSNIDFKVTSVLISVDQSVLADWDEIDAVELVGTP